jgi:putative transposase
MKPQFQPWQFLLLILAGWINRSQQDAAEYLITENRILREKLGKKRILLNDDQRRRLAVKGKILSIGRTSCQPSLTDAGCLACRSIECGF